GRARPVDRAGRLPVGSRRVPHRRPALDRDRTSPGDARPMTVKVLASRVQLAARAARPVMTGRVSKVVGLNLEVEGVEAAIGEAIAVETPGEPLMAEVVAIRDTGLVCMPFGDRKGVRSG